MYGVNYKRDLYSQDEICSSYKLRVGHVTCVTQSWTSSEIDRDSSLTFDMMLVTKR